MMASLGKCIRCDANVQPLGDNFPLNPDNAMQGVVYGGYGSRHDLSSLKVYLCDTCADGLKKEMEDYNPFIVETE